LTQRDEGSDSALRNPSLRREGPDNFSTAGVCWTGMHPAFFVFASSANELALEGQIDVQLLR
jgi:hypothetical protein